MLENVIIVLNVKKILLFLKKDNYDHNVLWKHNFFQKNGYAFTIYWYM